jgi:hypothetical protein
VILLLEGATSGLWWELEQVRGVVPLERIERKGDWPELRGICSLQSLRARPILDR